MFLVILVFSCLTLGKREEAANEEPIEVFIVAHTHDDVGWIISVDQYYLRQVQFILDSCIQQLLDNPERKFTYVEVAYFERWWSEISEQKKNLVRQLYKRGQLEFNLGGVTMNDEATTTSFEEVNQMTEGAAFLMRELGAIPQSAWHIDPFGHSAATASLWADVGFNAFILNRIPIWLKEQKKQDQELEFIWRSSKSRGKENDMWIHVLDTWYSSPSACAFDANNGWDGIYVQDDPRLFDVNVQAIGESFANMAKRRAAYYRHKKLLIPFGDDFAHREAYNSFVNMDKLIRYVNSNSSLGVKAKYAFLSDYIKAVHALNLTWPVYEGDFFTYVDNPSSYWSGYFTSRPLLKSFVRNSNALLHNAELLYSLARPFSNKKWNAAEAFADLEVMRQATSIATHHDAVSGTETQVTADDYTKRLQIGTVHTHKALTEIASGTTLSGNDIKPFQASLVNQSVLVFNSLGWARKEFVSMLTNQSDVMVFDDNGHLVTSQVNPVAPYSIDFARGKYRLFFLADMPPLGSRVYNLRYSSSGVNSNAVKPKVIQCEDCAQLNLNGIANKYVSLTLNSSTNRVSGLSNKYFGIDITLDQNFLQYFPATSEEGQASGAYIFRPTSNTVAHIGDSQSNNRKVLTRHFPKSFETTPYIFALPKGQDYSDTFSLTTRAVDNNKVVFNVYRVDSNGSETWAQDLQMDYFALDSDTFGNLSAGGIAAIPKSQFGLFAVGPSTQQLKTVTIQFPEPFQPSSSSPNIFLMARGQNVDDTFAISIREATSSYCVVNIYRLDSTSGWTQNLQLNWWAFPSSDNNSPSSQDFLTGRTNVGSSPSSPIKTVAITHPPFVGNPLVFATVRAAAGSALTDETWVVSSRAVTTTSMILNIFLVNGNGWKSDIEIDWLVAARKPVIESVLPQNEKVDSTFVLGPYVQEIQQFYRGGYAQTIRIFSGSGNELEEMRVEFVNEIGPLDQGRELITRFSTNLQNNKVIYTDDNGLLLQERAYNISMTELEAGNYYPMVARVYMRDTKRNAQFTLLSDSTHGTGGLREGEVEVMLHRRCLSDDSKGVGEVLNETTRIQPSLWALLADPINSALLHRQLAIVQQFPMALIPKGISSSSGTGLREALKQPLNGTLPPNVHLFSLNAVDGTSNKTLLRLQHIFEIDEHPQLSLPVKVDIRSLFAPPYKVSNITEMNLTANQKKSDVKRFHWNSETDTKAETTTSLIPRDNVVILKPTEIRTFLVEFGLQSV